MEVPSLNKLSLSTMRANLDGTPSVRKQATTATGSVAAISAPKTSAVGRGRPTPAHRQRDQCPSVANQSDSPQSDPQTDAQKYPA